VNVYDLKPEERKERGISELPGSLREALLDMDNDPVIKNALGANLYEAFVRAKWAEWEDYRLNVMDWEVARYLETVYFFLVLKSDRLTETCRRSVFIIPRRWPVPGGARLQHVSRRLPGGSRHPAERDKTRLPNLVDAGRSQRSEGRIRSG